MEQRLVRKILQIEGMVCTNCEMRIENTLIRLEGVVDAKAIFSSSNVYITYDANVIELDQIIESIQKLNYIVRNNTGEVGIPGRNSRKAAEYKMSISRLLGIAFIILALYIIINYTVGFNFIPEVNRSIKVVSGLLAVSDKGIHDTEYGGFSSEVSIPTDKIAVGKIDEDVQYISIDVNDERFSPAVIVLQKGIQTKWVINGRELNSHNNVMVFPEFNARISLNTGENEIEFIPESNFTLQCRTGTLNGYVKVVEDINKINMDDIKTEVENYRPPSRSFYEGAVGVSCH